MLRFAVVLTFASTALAQTALQSVPRPEPTGIITGHVLCADTQRPARLAEVKLVRVPTKDDAKIDPKKTSFSDSAPAGDAVETSLDGSYTLRNVKPGQYYVVVDKEGYLLPLAAFSLKDLADPDVETKARIANAIHIVTVLPNQTASEDVTLERGASVSGTVLYDDGSPASGIGISILAKDKDGKWTPIKAFRYRSNYGFLSTDDNGHYRLAGLPPGEYATQANLALSDHETSIGPMPGNPSATVQMNFTKTRFSLPLYSGDVLHKPDAKAYTLGTGEARAGEDLVFPLAKLHKVGGQLLARDGHALNAGKIELLYPDDNSKMTEADVQYDDSAFHLEFVPEGDFLLKVSDAKDVTKSQIENPAGYTPRFHEETKTLKTYGSTQQPLSVKGDMSGVIAMVPEASSKNPSPTVQ
jgi:5-hydroxyisourate hydrolase-like protein (transthyretin family)